MAERSQPAQSPPIGNQDKLWDYYQTAEVDSFAGSEGRLRFLVERVPAGTKVLNIGVGGGVFESIAHRMGLDVYALDPSARTIELLCSHLPLGDKAQVGYSQAMPFGSNSFGAVVISEVLEHLSDDVLQQSLVEIHRVLAPNGIILGTVPAREDLRSQLVVCPDCGVKFHRWGHLQSFDSQRVSEMLSPLFDVLEVKERPFLTLSTLNWKGKIVGVLKYLLWGIGVHGTGEHVFFKARVRK